MLEITTLKIEIIPDRLFLYPKCEIPLFLIIFFNILGTHYTISQLLLFYIPVLDNLKNASCSSPQLWPTEVIIKAVSFKIDCFQNCGSSLWIKFEEFWEHFYQDNACCGNRIVQSHRVYGSEYSYHDLSKLQKTR